MFSTAVVHALLVGDETQALNNALFLPDMFLVVYFMLPREKNLLCTLSYGPVLPRSSTFTAVPAYLVWTATDCELVKTFRFSRSCSGDTL